MIVNFLRLSYLPHKKAATNNSIIKNSCMRYVKNVRQLVFALGTYFIKHTYVMLYKRIVKFTYPMPCECFTKETASHLSHGISLPIASICIYMVHRE